MNFILLHYRNTFSHGRLPVYRASPVSMRRLVEAAGVEPEVDVTTIGVYTNLPIFLNTQRLQHHFFFVFYQNDSVT
jgi:hypothetical protein